MDVHSDNGGKARKAPKMTKADRAIADARKIMAMGHILSFDGKDYRLCGGKIPQAVGAACTVGAIEIGKGRWKSRSAP